MESPSFGFTCPNDIRRYADRAKNYTTVTWPTVIATDNSGVTPNVSTIGVRSIYYIGKQLVMYNASDKAGNFKICMFYVNIEGKMLVAKIFQSRPCTLKCLNMPGQKTLGHFKNTSQ